MQKVMPKFDLTTVQAENKSSAGRHFFEMPIQNALQERKQ
jgi:hypothetical protein